MKKIKFSNVLEWENFTKKNNLTKYLHNIKYIHLKKALDKLNLKTIRILDIGCGFADTFNLLNQCYQIEYLGIEDNYNIFTETQKRYANFKNFNLENQNILKLKFLNNKYDIIIMFDVLEHINLDERFNLLKNIKKTNFSKLFINVPNEVGFSIILKNFGSMIMGYNRYKEYNTSETFNSLFGNIEKFPPHIDQHKGFDWKVLKYMLHYFYEINKISTIASSLVPKNFSPSIFFECNKRLY